MISTEMGISHIPIMVMKLQLPFKNRKICAAVSCTAFTSENKQSKIQKKKEFVLRTNI